MANQLLSHQVISKGSSHVALPAVRPGSCPMQAAGENYANLAIYGLAFLLTTLGIVYVQEAERKIPMNYANRYRAGALSPQSYLPFKARPRRCLSSLLLRIFLHVRCRPQHSTRYVNSPRGRRLGRGNVNAKCPHLCNPRLLLM